MITSEQAEILIAIVCKVAVPLRTQEEKQLQDILKELDEIVESKKQEKKLAKVETKKEKKEKGK